MPRSAKTGAGDEGFDAKLRTAIKKKSLIDVQQLLRDTLPRARQTAKVETVQQHLFMNIKDLHMLQF